jgi:hypothetical protein
MRVRCSHCAAEYEAAVTRAALVLVDRCERCGRAKLSAVEDPPDDRDDRVDSAGGAEVRHLPQRGPRG